MTFQKCFHKTGTGCPIFSSISWKYKLDKEGIGGEKKGDGIEGREREREEERGRGEAELTSPMTFQKCFHKTGTCCPIFPSISWKYK
jgi:hypothetical protein